MFDLLLELVLEILMCVLIFPANLSCDFEAPTFCLFPMHIPQEEGECSVSFLGKPQQYLLPISANVNPFFATWMGKI